MDEKMMLDKKVWAVVGATDNPNKFGNKIYNKLKTRGYKVYPVNPNYENIGGDRCYKNLSDLPEVPDVVDMVVAPRHGMEVVDEAARLGVKNIWLQPGTYNADLMNSIDKNGLNSVQACVLTSLE